MLSPPLLTSARQAVLIYPSVVGGRFDEEHLMSVFSNCVGSWRFLALTGKSGRSEGNGQGIKTLSREQSAGAAGRITLGRCSTFLGWELLFQRDL